MNETQGCLKNEQLRRLMECELAAADVAEAEEHLSVCDHCRAMLDRAIGNADWWQEARESLSPGEGDRPVAGETASVHSDVLALLGPTDDPHMLGRIGPYEIIGILGRGGMGVVFKGFDGALNRYVAIKMLLPHLAASGAARKRFAREAQAAAAVVHDHVMAIHNVSEWQGVPYLVMPYGRGVSLQRRLSDKGPLEVREILRIGMQTAAGLAAAHAQGLVHRDVKPANILLDDGVERVTLTDFGLARAVDDASLTRHGTLAGTPQYMSPEQARAKAVDARSDLFSLGSVLYAMCTGRSPFRADSSYGVLRLIT
ncbi:MAG: serine/threonine protein kinase, partial [Pirellulaceae bacterium]|nr:serine/threonine protein kinase [Pirellulaceae bacterium]